MKWSHLFTKTRREAPADEVSKNAILLTRAGYIHKEMAGVYSYLPLGLRVLEKIRNIIREEMNAIGGQEVLLTTLQDPEVWKKTGRWSDEVVDVWFKSKLAGGGDIGIGNTHEEPLTALMKEHIQSHRDLPKYVYQIQMKFRNELRAKSGLMRGREFLMKDLYSFCRDEKELEDFYEKCADAYMKIFTRAGIGDRTYRTFASGGSFSKFSDEFQTLSEAGEDIIYIDEKRRVAINREIYADDILKELGLDKNGLVEKKAIEVGNIFKLGTRFSELLSLQYRDENSALKPVVMGSYGIGLGRLMGTVVEALADERGIVWPESIAPFAVYLVSLGKDEQAGQLYDALGRCGVEVFLDDRDASAGEKFADADLLGMPRRVVVSEKSLKAGGVEVKERTEKNTRIISKEEFLKEYSPDS